MSLIKTERIYRNRRGSERCAHQLQGKVLFPFRQHIAGTEWCGFAELCSQEDGTLVGRGFQKIRDGFEADGIPMPKVENFCGGVRVSIERTVFVKLSHVGSSVGSDVTSSVTSMSPVKLSERQQDMLELIRKNPFISAQQMSVVLSVVKRTIERDLADLQKKGILIREGNTSAGHWEIIEK